ncbi:hypothetical protein GCM10009627_30000 [Curtobacterium herbarum]|uniref:Uncharacterized protein n=1 Tax=Curtobacterium herbarum TaxID=150122 RepID=A0ABN1ZGJ2_9MICO
MEARTVAAPGCGTYTACAGSDVETTSPALKSRAPTTVTRDAVRRKEAPELRVGRPAAAAVRVMCRVARSTRGPAATVGAAARTVFGAAVRAARFVVWVRRAAAGRVAVGRVAAGAGVLSASGATTGEDGAGGVSGAALDDGRTGDEGAGGVAGPDRADSERAGSGRAGSGRADSGRAASLEVTVRSTSDRRRDVFAAARSASIRARLVRCTDGVAPGALRSMVVGVCEESSMRSVMILSSRHGRSSVTSR